MYFLIIDGTLMKEICTRRIGTGQDTRMQNISFQSKRLEMGDVSQKPVKISYVD